MGFGGFYPDGTDKDTGEPIHEITPPVPIPSDTTPEEIGPKKEELIPPPDEKLSNQKYVIDTTHNKTDVNTDRIAQVVADLKGYAEGTPLIVTYYKQNFSETTTRHRRKS